MGPGAFSPHGTCRWPQGMDRNGPARDPARVSGNADRPGSRRASARRPATPTNPYPGHSLALNPARPSGGPSQSNSVDGSAGLPPPPSDPSSLPDIAAAGRLGEDQGQAALLQLEQTRRVLREWCGLSCGLAHCRCGGGCCRFCEIPLSSRSGADLLHTGAASARPGLLLATRRAAGGPARRALVVRRTPPRAGRTRASAGSWPSRSPATPLRSPSRRRRPSLSPARP